jgi:DNA-binding phage protein
MSRRTRDWDEGLAEDLKDPTFAKEFLLAAVEEEISLQEALAKVIRCYGIKEFAEMIGIPSSNLSRALDQRHNPTQETLNKLLQPFGLIIGVRPLDEHRRRIA